MPPSDASIPRPPVTSCNGYRKAPPTSSQWRRPSLQAMGASCARPSWRPILPGSNGSEPPTRTTNIRFRRQMHDAESAVNQSSTGGRSERRDPRGGCMAALHNKCFPDGQKSGITPPADADDGHLPVPSQQLFPSGGFRSPHFMGRGFRRPIFLFFVRRF